MPLYVYLAKDPKKGCPHCKGPFEVLQSMKDKPLAACPECGAPVAKQVASVNSAFPKGPAALRNMGMARLEKRHDGNYENVSAQPGTQRVGPLDSFADSLSKGKRRIIND